LIVELRRRRSTRRRRRSINITERQLLGLLESLWLFLLLDFLHGLVWFSFHRTAECLVVSNKERVDKSTTIGSSLYLLKAIIVELSCKGGKLGLLKVDRHDYLAEFLLSVNSKQLAIGLPTDNNVF
jgi:hypothetical protein